MKRTELKRKTPLQRKRAKPRRVAAKCSVRGCSRTPQAAGMCLTHCKREADRLFSLLIRAKGYCARCGGREWLQCSHVVPRGYLAVRWEPANAECVCRSCHAWQHNFPLENEVEVRARIGSRLFDFLRARALTREAKPDYEAVLARLGYERRADSTTSTGSAAPR